MARVKTSTRTISNAGPLRTLALVATPKAQGELPTESLVEYDGLLHMCFDSDILSIKVQPEIVPLSVNGKPVTYIPDVRFIRRDGRIGFREFKQDKSELSDDERMKYQAAAAHFRRQGFEFSIIDADELRIGYRLSNIKLLKRYSQCLISIEHQKIIREYLQEHPSSVLSEMRRRVGPQGSRTLYRMLWDQQVGADLDGEPLGATTRVWRLAP